MRIKINREVSLRMTAIASLAICGITLPFGSTQDLAHAETGTNAAAVKVDRAKATEVLNQYCVSCHGPDKQKGDVRLDDFDLIDAVALQDMLAKAREAVHFEEMPPAKAKQPSEADRKALLDWLGNQLSGDAAKKLQEKLERPESGNYVNHEDLFSGEYADAKPFTYDRRWLISDYIFNEKFHRIFNDRAKEKVDGVSRFIAGSTEHPVKLTNPFGPDQKGGLRYYANISLDSGQVQTMLANARNASDYMILLAKQQRNYLPAINALLATRYKHEDLYNSRKQFLEAHIDRVLNDVFKDQHEPMLPAFVPVQQTDNNEASQEGYKRAPYHAANPGRDELGEIYRTFKKYKDKALSEEQILAAAEREWFYYGEKPDVIQRRLTFYNNYTEEFWANEKVIKKYAPYGSAADYKPLGESEMLAVNQSVRKYREQGDTYRAVITKCLDGWEKEFEQEIARQGPAPEEVVRTLVVQLFNKIYERQPSAEEAEQYTELASRFMATLGTHDGIARIIQTLLMKSEFLYRHEFGQGEAEEHGRRMMSARDASYAIAYALTDSSPDADLVKAVKEGKLNTRADYVREVKRILAQRDRYYLIDDAVHGKQNAFNITNMPIRELRFFREFFAYPKMLAIFKDEKRFGGIYERATSRIVAEADRLVEYILEHDRDVFNQLLTTDSFYVYHSGDNQAMAEAAWRIRKINDYFKNKNWQDFTYQDLLNHKDFLDEVDLNFISLNAKNKDQQKKTVIAFKRDLESFTRRFESGRELAAPYSSQPGGPGDAKTRGGVGLRMPEVAKLYNINLIDWEYPTTQPAPIQNRRGLLTHPAWLIAFSHNTETDPIRRGKWIRERLLADTIPDVPITVDAVVPEDPHKTLRQRMEAKTGEAYCWTCHQKMEPLGLPFEIYDDFGRFRTEESLEYPENLIEKVKDKGQPHEDLRDTYKTLPIDSAGYLSGTDDSTLDGHVKDAPDLIDRLAKSERVRQSIIRHAFRYFIGRNEMLSDSKTLIDADRAYVESGGSFDAVIVSLLTSDSFIYRKEILEKD
jgi:mono/diheme cytochrome c family protein